MAALTEEEAATAQAASVHATIALLANSSRDALAAGAYGLAASIVPGAPDERIANMVYGRAGALALGYHDVHDAYLRASVREWTVWIDAGNEAERAYLAARSYKQSETLTAMTRDLSQTPKTDARRGSVEIRSDEAIGVVGRINGAAHDSPELIEALSRKPRSEHVRAYSARLTGRPVSALMTIDVPTEDGRCDCTIAFVATHPEWQGQGFARRVLTTALNDAARRGCRAAVLQATEEGAWVYRSVGFVPSGGFELYRRRT
ncbi:GNAT family N-acetyltransferase [Conexibacter woesei]|uniref:GCN5-related N-acetyltransferase n=1 Tax=Conexibacter woesei (strain DSM 14684 / CCUG 47730 / CIP 108061 / JCM 11494 / NBRC 100937 / ID131577) TaxID=469383 RepID=D3EZ20_CONWI|nr:GNAT family N-acetyltransferase [Conexibacter woesei]ADB49894.1 GCN5-related N-acetyltransferase [Conexibacter woesei DSM 14684]